MSKKDFIALADAIKEHNRVSMTLAGQYQFESAHLETIARFL